MEYLIVGLVFVAVVLGLLYWRSWSLSKEREKTAAMREELIVVGKLSFAKDRIIVDLTRQVRAATDLKALADATRVQVEREHAQLRLELQKYENGSQKLGRLGRS